MPENWEDHPSVEAVIEFLRTMPGGDDFALATVSSKIKTPKEFKSVGFKWIQGRIDELRKLTKLIEAIPNDLK